MHRNLTWADLHRNPDMGRSAQEPGKDVNRNLPLADLHRNLTWTNLHRNPDMDNSAQEPDMDVNRNLP